MEQTHGGDVKGNLFRGQFPLLYAIEGAIVGGYERQSANTAMLLNCALGSIKNKAIADIGCGYGTTTKQLARFSPASIFACDNSPEMIELLGLIMDPEEKNIGDWLNERGGKELLPPYYQATLQFLEGRRQEFRNGIFVERATCGFCLRSSSKGLMEIHPLDCVTGFDGIAMNNVFHWPVNQIRAEMKEGGAADPETVRPAAVQVLSKIRNLLRPSGAAVMMEPKDFVLEDRDKDLEAYYEAHTLAANPVFRKVHETLNRLLKERFGIERSMPKSANLFPIGQFGDWADEAGLTLEQVVHMEDCDLGDALEWHAIRLLIWMGAVDIAFDQKVRIAEDVRNIVKTELSPKERFAPVRQQSFYFVLRRKD